MKNIILGIVGGLTIVYACLICISLYGSTSRANEMENALSQVVMSTLKENYTSKQCRDASYKPKTSSSVLSEVEEKLAARIHSESTYDVKLLACDMEKGILSVNLIEHYKTPWGKDKEVSYAKTAIVENP